MPCDYRRYPKDWKQIRKRIRARAGDRCEACGVKNGAWGYRDNEGRFHACDGPAEIEAAIVDDHKLIKIVCTVAHVNHDLSDNRDEVLRFWCQRCHNRHDVRHRQANAAKTRDRKRGQLPLLEETAQP
jgi:ssDNA-binding Zn-finger/Zn-ribbon topoisomerase 1